MAVIQEPFLYLAVDGPHCLTSNNTDTHYPGTRTHTYTLTGTHVLATHSLLGAAPALMCNWHDWWSPWQRECWPWQVPREQLVGSGRLVSKQIYSQSSTACPLNRGRNHKEAIRLRGNKEGIVVQLSESTDGEEERRGETFSWLICQLAGGVDECEWGARSATPNDQKEAWAFIENNTGQFTGSAAVI